MIWLTRQCNWWNTSNETTPSPEVPGATMVLFGSLLARYSSMTVSLVSNRGFSCVRYEKRSYGGIGTYFGKVGPRAHLSGRLALPGMERSHGYYPKTLSACIPQYPKVVLSYNISKERSMGCRN